MSKNKVIAKNTIILYIRMFFVMFISLYTSRIVLKTLGVEDYGIYSVVGGIVTMFSFLNGALGAASSRFLTFELGKKDLSKLKQTFSTCVIIHIFIAIIIFILAETVGLWFLMRKMVIPEERMVAAHWVYQFSIFSSLLSITQVPYNAVIIAYEKMNIFAYISLVEVVAKLIIVYLIQITIIPDKLIFYSLLIFILSVSVMTIYRFYCIRSYPECKLYFQKEKEPYKKIMTYTGYDLIGNVSVMAQGQGLNMLLNLFFGPAVNAARGIAYQVQTAVSQFSSNIMTASRPQIIKLYAEGKTSEMMGLVYNVSSLSYYLLLLIIVPLSLEINFILKLWLGDYPEHTVNFTLLVLLYTLIQSIKTPRTTVFHAIGELKLVNLTVGTILCSVLPISYFILKAGYPPESVFIAMIGVLFIAEVASIIVLKKYINYNIRKYIINVYGKCLLVTIISLPLPIIVYLSMDDGIIRFITISIASVFSTCVTIYCLGINKEYRKKIRLFIKEYIYKK